MYNARKRYKIALIHVANFKAKYFTKKKQEAQAKKAFEVRKKQQNKPPVNHGDQGVADDVSDDRQRRLHSPQYTGKAFLPQETLLRYTLHCGLIS